MKGGKVYLSGPMDCASEVQGKVWRRIAKEFLEKSGIEVSNPYDFKQDLSTPSCMVKTDLRHIIACDGLLTNASQEIVTWGSPMETMWARMNGVITVAFVYDLRPSPWLLAHAQVVRTLEQATERMAWLITRL